MAVTKEELAQFVNKIPVSEHKKKERTLLSVNDVRKKYGLPTLNDPNADKPMIPKNEIK